LSIANGCFLAKVSQKEMITIAKIDPRSGSGMV
jgi:hypothetical protein